MKKETLSETAENFWLNDDSMTENDRISYVNGFLTCAKWQMDRQDIFAIGFAEWLTNEQSPYSITYGNQEKRFSDFRKEYTAKELLEIYKKGL
jgi:hypothetical protein